MKKLLSTISILLVLQVETIAQLKFNGTFENKEYNLMMTVKKMSQNYEVFFLFNGDVYRGTAKDNLGFISGNYEFNSQKIIFSFSKILGQFFFTSEGKDVPMIKISETISTLKPKVKEKTPVVSKAPLNSTEKAWRQRIAGKRLLYLYTGNGYSDKWFFDLCSNGTYVYGDDTSYTSGGNFSAVVANNESGTWAIQTRNGNTILVLISKNSKREFTINPRSASNEIDMNGKRYFIYTNNSCN